MEPQHEYCKQVLCSLDLFVKMRGHYFHRLFWKDSFWHCWKCDIALSGFALWNTLGTDFLIDQISQTSLKSLVFCSKETVYPSERANGKNGGKKNCLCRLATLYPSDDVGSPESSFINFISQINDSCWVLPVTVLNSDE